MPRKRKHGEKLIAHGYAVYPSMLAEEPVFGGDKGIGLGVEISIFYYDWPQERPFPAAKGTIYDSRIGVMDSSGILCRSNSVIEYSRQLRIYVSR